MDGAISQTEGYIPGTIYVSEGKYSQATLSLIIVKALRDEGFMYFKTKKVFREGYYKGLCVDLGTRRVFIPYGRRVSNLQDILDCGDQFPPPDSSPMKLDLSIRGLAPFPGEPIYFPNKKLFRDVIEYCGDRCFGSGIAKSSAPLAPPPSLIPGKSKDSFCFHEYTPLVAEVGRFIHYEAVGAPPPLVPWQPNPPLGVPPPGRNGARAPSALTLSFKEEHVVPFTNWLGKNPACSFDGKGYVTPHGHMSKPSNRAKYLSHGEPRNVVLLNYADFLSSVLPNPRA
jgi:hypothetical protein